LATNDYRLGSRRKVGLETGKYKKEVSAVILRPQLAYLSCHPNMSLCLCKVLFALQAPIYVKPRVYDGPKIT
jgi:hypothetical protein